MLSLLWGAAPKLGDSQTHSRLSPNGEWCFGGLSFYLATQPEIQSFRQKRSLALKSLLKTWNGDFFRVSCQITIISRLWKKSFLSHYRNQIWEWNSERPSSAVFLVYLFWPPHSRLATFPRLRRSLVETMETQWISLRPQLSYVKYSAVSLANFQIWRKKRLAQFLVF